MSTQDKDNRNPEQLEQQNSQQFDNKKLNNDNKSRLSKNKKEDNLLNRLYSKYENRKETSLDNDSNESIKSNLKSKRDNCTKKFSLKIKKDNIDIYAFISEVGYKIGSFFSKLLGFILFLLIYPFEKLWISIKHFWRWLDKAYINSLRRFADEYLYFRKEVRAVRGDLVRAIKDSPKSIFKIIWHYFIKALKRHPIMFRTMTNIALPVIASIVLITTISYWNGATFALEVKCNGQKLGYISDESVYLNAQEIVKDRLETNSNAAKKVLKAPEYKLALISPNELTDAQTISDRIVENTEGDITSACGIYIEGKFICAIKNEMDAIQLFNSILDDYTTENPNDVIGFVEDVKYIQGLYPDNKDTIWDTQRLLNKLQGKKQEAVYYTVQKGDTLSGIANKNDIRLSQLIELNPKFSEKIMIGDKLLVSNEVNYLRIKVVKTEVVEEKIPYETTKKENSKLFKGTKRVKKKGKNGIAKVTRLATYVDGLRISSQEVNREVVKNPVGEILEVGTKSTRVYSKGGYSVTVRGKLVWPIIGLHRVSSPYGPRNGGFHRGIDLTGPSASGHIIVAADGGRVISAGWAGSYGYRVMVDHGNGMVTLYAHCLRNSISVRTGQHVNPGEALARVGSTGNSTGPHLHFEVRRNGTKVNPAPYLGLRR